MGKNLDWHPDQSGSAATEDFAGAVGGGGTAPPHDRSFQGAAAAFLLRRLLHRLIRKGTLKVTLPDGREIVTGTGHPQVDARILQPAMVLRLFRNPDLALGEAYTEGALVLERGSVYDLLVLAMQNLGLSNGPGLMHVNAQLRRFLRRIAQHNPVARARANVAHHYDLSDRLYELFLDAGRQYSCAYFTAPTDTLEQAQDQKKRHIAAKLLLHPGLRVLDIGSGWGGLGLYLAQSADVSVTGLTLSTEQHTYAAKSTAEAGLQDRLQFHLRDYHHEQAHYDRVVSVGMFEHVGVGHYREYFEKLASLLTDDGIALIHTIGSARPPHASNPWINKYIFPGAYAPSLSEITPEIERAGFYIADVEVLRLHYAQTLRAWHNRFMAHRSQIAAIYDERFCRMWEYYLAYCEAAFRYTGLVVFQIQISKRLDAVPLTRGYIAEWEQAQGEPSPESRARTNTRF